MSRISSVIALFVFSLPSALAHAGELPKPNAAGIRVHRIVSEHQAGRPTEIRVLVPDNFDKSKRYPVIYVLPVEAGQGKVYGDGLAEILKHNLHNKYGVIFVAPTFSHLPWYADHATNARIRQETYFIQVVLPFIEKHYPVSMVRWLLGFSKSGWGAFSLLLRHPELFAKAVAWDAPVLMTQPNKYGMAEIFGTQANFEKYDIAKQLTARGKSLGKEPRLALIGYANFRSHHVEANALMKRLGIPHEYRDAKKTPHTWHSGWVVDGVQWLVRGT